MRLDPCLTMRFAISLAAVATGCRKEGPTEDARVALVQPLPALVGDSVTVTLVEVKYGPGGGSSPHRHPCAVIGYVTAGAVKTQVRGGPVEVFQVGQTFYEPANGVHQVSANASTTEPVQFLATFICDRSAPLSTPVSDSAGGG